MYSMSVNVRFLLVLLVHTSVTPHNPDINSNSGRYVECVVYFGVRSQVLWNAPGICEIPDLHTCVYVCTSAATGGVRCNTCSAVAGSTSPLD